MLCKIRAICKNHAIAIIIFAHIFAGIIGGIIAYNIEVIYGSIYAGIFVVIYACTIAGIFTGIFTGKSAQEYIPLDRNRFQIANRNKYLLEVCFRSTF